MRGNAARTGDHHIWEREVRAVTMLKEGLPRTIVAEITGVHPLALAEYSRIIKRRPEITPRNVVGPPPRIIERRARAARRLYILGRLERRSKEAKSPDECTLAPGETCSER
jgi:hypothetical protein